MDKIHLIYVYNSTLQSIQVSSGHSQYIILQVAYLFPSLGSIMGLNGSCVDGWTHVQVYSFSCLDKTVCIIPACLTVVQTADMTFHP